MNKATMTDPGVSLPDRVALAICRNAGPNGASFITRKEKAAVRRMIERGVLELVREAPIDYQGCTTEIVARIPVVQADA